MTKQEKRIIQQREAELHNELVIPEEIAVLLFFAFGLVFVASIISWLRHF